MVNGDGLKSHCIMLRRFEPCSVHYKIGRKAFKLICSTAIYTFIYFRLLIRTDRFDSYVCWFLTCLVAVQKRNKQIATYKRPQCLKTTARIPEWSKGTVLRAVALCFAGSNPAPCIINKSEKTLNYNGSLAQLGRASDS